MARVEEHEARERIKLRVKDWIEHIIKLLRGHTRLAIGYRANFPSTAL